MVYLVSFEKQFTVIFIGFGDFKQLKPPNGEHTYFQNRRLVNRLFNHNCCQLTKVYGFDENKLLQDADDCANGKSIDFKRYGNKE